MENQMTELSTTKPGLPPVSLLLEAELKQTIKERGLLIWLDADDNYSEFARGLQARAESGEFSFPVVCFDGSFLELMLDVEKYGNGLHPEKVVIHMPGYNEQTIADTPLYELFKAGKRYRKGLDTLIEEACVGLVRPDDGKKFRQDKPTLAAADKWLSETETSEHDLFLIALEGRSTESVLTEVFSDDSKLYKELEMRSHVVQLLEYFHKSIGLTPDTWLPFLRVPSAEDEARNREPRAYVRFIVASWLMAVEFVGDLQEDPFADELKTVRKVEGALRAVCDKLVHILRDQFHEEYMSLSGQFEDILGRDKADHSASALGAIDTFRFEEAKIRAAALVALSSGSWESAKSFALERHPEACFWVKHDKNRERTWELIQLAAEVGEALRDGSDGLKGCASLEEATNRYRDKLHKVDHAHRRFEQRYYKLHSTELEDESELRDARDTVRQGYRAWADKLARQFADLCENLGALPSPDLRQRAVYENFVHPIIEGGDRVAFFLVDAMRFEMADELRDFFESKKYRTTLNARLAELPTVTEVGMNALAPVAQMGKLRPVISDRNFGGFRCSGSVIVKGPPSRVSAMESRSVNGKATSLELSQVTQATPGELSKMLKMNSESPLLVVRSLELDSAGEKGFHLGTFEGILVQIREAVQRLQKAGISRFVLAADHGFLLQDHTASLEEYSDSPKRRHVLTSQRSGKSDVLEIALSALDYEVEEEKYLVFRRDTAIWKVQNKIAPFVHGGNSLQERVIPVLCLEKRSKAGGSTAQYEVVAKALPAEGGRERLSLKVRLEKQTSGLLSFAGPDRISLALRVVGADGRKIDALPTIVEVTPPGTLNAGTVLVPPGTEEATVTFSIEGEFDEKVRVEVYHPDASEKVTSKIVDGWFEMHRNRKLGRLKGAAPAEAADEAPPSEKPVEVGAAWANSFEDEEFRKVFQLIESQESINEQELHMLLKNARRVRSFARNFDELKAHVPFEVQIMTIGGMKSYVKGDKR